MARAGKLRLNLVDVYGDRLDDVVDITLRHRVLAEERKVEGRRARTRILIDDLRGAPQGLYSVEVRPSSYMPTSRFVNVEASGITDLTIPFAIDPDHVGRVEFPTFARLDRRLKEVLERSDGVLGLGGQSGKALYDALSVVQKAGLLNLAVKSFVTPFREGESLLPHLTLLELRGDRCFVGVPGRLRAQVEQAARDGVFRKVDGSLHSREGFAPAGSFKTPDAYGNLQLTFFARGQDHVADVDIDDAAGLGHVFQVLRNHLENRATHPYDIHEILVFHQRLDPGYRLFPQA